GRRWIYAGLGLASTGIGIVGVFVPGLPTTVFVLIALWMFAQSSARLHDWLRHNRLLRPAVEEADRFRRERTLGIRVKIVAQSFAWGSFAVVAGCVRDAAIGAPVLLAAVACTVAMGCIPTARYSRKEAPKRSAAAATPASLASVASD